jgi:hypothetical protein
MQTGRGIHPTGSSAYAMADNAIVECNLAQEKPTPAGTFEPRLYQAFLLRLPRNAGRLVHRPRSGRYGAL